MYYLQNPSPPIDLAKDTEVKIAYKDHEGSGSTATTGVLDGKIHSVSPDNLLTVYVEKHFGADDCLVRKSILLGQTITISSADVFTESQQHSFIKERDAWYR